MHDLYMCLLLLSSFITIYYMLDFISVTLAEFKIIIFGQFTSWIFVNSNPQQASHYAIVINYPLMGLIVFA